MGIRLLRRWTIFVLGLANLVAQEKARSVWDGVYSSAQAGRGEAGYGADCASCHGKTLEGRGQIPPLAGGEFTSNWNGMTVGDLFEKMRTSMPADRPGQLSPEENAAILAYILKINKFPPGNEDLPGDPGKLGTIRFDADKPGK